MMICIELVSSSIWTILEHILYNFQEKWVDAVERYRDVLRSAEEHKERIKTGDQSEASIKVM